MRLMITRLTLDQAFQVRVLDAQFLIPLEPAVVTVMAIYGEDRATN